MKTLKEIHESQDENLGYKVKSKSGEVMKVISYDSDYDLFFLININDDKPDWFRSTLTCFTLEKVNQ